MQFQKNLIITGKIVTKTGLHIGGNKADLKIGGTDNPVITDQNGRPYIPGSSLKGKLRSLLEYSEGKINNNGSVHNCGDPDCPICAIFGTSSEKISGPSRLIVRDSFASKDVDLELKTENMINRLEGKAEHPRTTERIPPGTEFDFEMVYSIYEEKDYRRLDYLFRLLSMLEDSYLGGSGSRGYGKIEIRDIKIRKKTLKDYAEGGSGAEAKIDGAEGATPKILLEKFDDILAELK